MFARASSAFVLALPVLAAAGSILPRTGGQCNTGPVQCCQSSQSVSNLSLQFHSSTNYLSQATSLTYLTTLLLESLQINVGSLTGLVGRMFLSQDSH